MLPKVGQVGLLFSNDLVFLYTFISGWPLHSSALVCFYERKATNRILPLLSYRVVTSYIFRAVLILISNLLPLLKTHLPLLPLLCRNLKFPELYIFCHIQKFTAKKKKLLSTLCWRKFPLLFFWNAPRPLLGPPFSIKTFPDPPWFQNPWFSHIRQRVYYSHFTLLPYLKIRVS